MKKKLLHRDEDESRKRKQEKKVPNESHKLSCVVGMTGASSSGAPALSTPPPGAMEAD